MSAGPYSGGCQCGAIRYRVDGELSNPHVCHCRMCQKAAGNYFMPLAKTPVDAFTLTRGSVAWFHSSDPVRRGFCANCGTPLFFETVGVPIIYIVLGSLDDPASVQPQAAYGVEATMPWIADICAREGTETEADAELDGVPIEKIAASNHQHPDHDTEQWTVHGQARKPQA